MDLVVKTRDGTPVTHDVTKNTVRMMGADGETHDFVSSDDVPVAVEKSIDVDWSGGDMVVTPEAGKVFSSILIPKPENALPENIKEGVVLAGLVGALAAGAGGGGGAVKVASGTVTLTTASFWRVETNHGFKPDLVLVYFDTAKFSPSSNVFAAFGLSPAIVAAGNTPVTSCLWTRTSSGIEMTTSQRPIDEDHYAIGISGADEYGFKCNFSPVAGTWQYLIVGGLT